MCQNSLPLPPKDVYKIQEYMRIFECAPALKAVGLEDTYKVLADFGDAVLAGTVSYTHLDVYKRQGSAHIGGIRILFSDNLPKLLFVKCHSFSSLNVKAEASEKKTRLSENYYIVCSIVDCCLCSCCGRSNSICS